MLARANRVTRPGDFRVAVRRGRRVVTDGAIVHVLDRHLSEPSRFGFVVGKTVGGAVTRNLVRRRLRAAGREILPTMGEGTDVVVRALPGCDSIDWATLHAELERAVLSGVSPRSTR